MVKKGQRGGEAKRGEKKGAETTWEKGEHIDVPGGTGSRRVRFASGKTAGIKWLDFPPGKRTWVTCARLALLAT
jgi:hypothetical protein